MRGEGTPDDERGPRCSSIVGVAGCPFDRLARRFMDRIIRLVTDPTVKGLWPDQSRGQFFEFTMDARAERQVLGEIAALVIDLDCPRQPAGSALWGSAPELLNI